ncbi:hypothetical protein [Flavobacterium sp.]|uniref:beta strand repeat-containing protein n=1 Tax=Flavobacterium sp. TaxID=239 RepID=UPI00261E0541|nr:hypothetical protein [Flavobacterium sp.]
MSCSAQIGLGTVTPQGALDVTSTTDGILIPRVALSATNVATVVTPTISEIVYNTFTSALGPNQVVPGFYYWDGAAWIAILSGSNSDWKLTGNVGTTAGTNFVGTTDAVDFVTKTNNTEKTRVTSAGNFGIGTSTPQGILDVTSTTDGLLIPRIALAATNVATVATPTTSEIVYNTFTSALGPNQVVPGFYYWDGTTWILMSTGVNSDWKLTGNAGTVAGTNFVGTTDAIDYVTKTNNTEKTRVTSAGNVGIGTSTPQGILDVTSTTDGLLIPRIALAATNVATVATPTTSEIVYNTFTSALGPNQVVPGFYYWNGTTWILMATGVNSDWKLTGNAGTVAGTNFVGTTDAIDYVTKTNNTEKTRVTSAGNFGIGTSTPQGILDVTSTTDGLLIPRIALAATNVATVVTPTTSEIVYNTFTSALGPNQVVPGFYYWNGTTWILMATGVNTDWKLTGNAGTVAGTNFVGTTDAIDYVTKTNNTEKTRVTSAGNFGIGTAAPTAKLDVAASTTVVNSIVNASGSINDYLQYNIQNTSTGVQAKSGFCAFADNGSATTNYMRIGVNNSTFNFPTAYNIGGADDVAFIGGGQDMYIANANNTKNIIFSTGKAASPYFDERMRVLNNGRVAINNIAPAATDQFTVTSSATSAYAINGYSANNGSGVYGSISAGTTTLGGVQGEYFGTASLGAGVRGLTFSATAGTTVSNANSAVNGQLGAGNGNTVFSFGIKGQAINNAGNQVGGVIGIANGGTDYGILGYRRSSGTIYSVLGNIAYQMNTTRGLQSNQESSGVGIGIDGGFLGGHIKGEQYGLIAKGNRFGSYTDGAAITNKVYAVVNENENGEKIATYASTSVTIDVTAKGVGQMVNGTATIPFDKNFAGLISKGKPVIVTVSPMGETNGIYVTSVSSQGFTVKENKAGTSTISFYWIAVGEKEDAAVTQVPKEVLAKDFDKNLESVLNIDEESNTAKAMWWNGTSLEFGKSAPISPQQNQGASEAIAKNKK